MIPKTKLVAHIFEGEVRYEVRSKSLPAALARASLVVEALGSQREIDIDHQFYESKKGNIKHQILVTVFA